MELLMITLFIGVILTALNAFAMKVFLKKVDFLLLGSFVGLLCLMCIPAGIAFNTPLSPLVFVILAVVLTPLPRLRR